MTRRRAARAGAAGVVILMVLGAGCVTAGQGAQRTNVDLGAWGGGDASFRVALGDPTVSKAADWPEAFDAPPIFADVDGDGDNEIVSTARDRYVRVYDDDGRLLAQMMMPLPPSWHIDQWLNGVAVGILTPGGPPTIVAATPAAGVVAWEYAGTASDGSLSFEQIWDRRLDDCHHRPGMDATPVLADVDGDGAQEMFFQVEQLGLFGLHSDGTTMWKQCWAGGNADAAVADLNGDGALEVVFASDSGFLSVLDAATGKPQWTFDAHARPYNIEPGSIPVRPTIADLDGKLPLEVLFTARYAPHNNNESFSDFHMAIFAVHQNPRTWQPELLWMRQPDWAHPLSYTQLIVDDVDDDGFADIFGMDWNTIGHQPGNWEHLGDAHVFRLDERGRDVWVRPVESWWSNKDIALGDFDGDGEPELLANGVNSGGDGFVRLDARTGATEGFLSAGVHKLSKGPTLGVIHPGGTLHLAAPAGPLEGTGLGTIMLYDLGIAGTLEEEKP